MLLLQFLGQVESQAAQLIIMGVHYLIKRSQRIIIFIGTIFREPLVL